MATRAEPIVIPACGAGWEVQVVPRGRVGLGFFRAIRPFPITVSKL